MSQKHTILLLQRSNSLKSRTYYDFASVKLAMAAICSMFEEELKQKFSHQKHITYDVDDLYRYIDEMGDLGALVLDLDSARYTPHNKDWIKQRILKHLQHIAAAQQKAS